jgi:lipopolysaccharide export system protein LptC
MTACVPVSYDQQRGDRPVMALEQHGGRGLAAVWPRSDGAADRWASQFAHDRYSRRVALLKRLLPSVGLALLLLVAVWPRLAPLLESVGLGFPAIDLREARELRMVNPRYAGTDRLNRPYVVTAAVGRQIANRDDLISLERPRAEMTMHPGANVVLTAATAVYQSQAQLLDLLDNVNLLHENGTRFLTQRAHADLSRNTAEGNDPVTGHGPSGDIAAQGFRVLDKGDRIIFTGKSDLLLKGTRPSASPAIPPGLPPEVTEAAAQIEAAALASPATAPEPATAGNAGTEPAYTQPSAEPHAAAKSREMIKGSGKMPSRRLSSRGRDAN